MSKRKMKDSGVEWLGEIPAEWDVRRGKTFLRLLSRPVKVDDDIVTCFRDGEVTLRKNRREDGFTVALKECGYQGVEPGDLVVHGMDGFAGSIGISDSRGKASPVLNVMDTSEDKRYVMYYLRSLAMRDVFLALSTGIRVRSCDLRWSKLGDIQYLLPPLSTQRKIAAYLDTRCAKIDEMVSDAKKTIEEYKAWKASVIFEAVTGKCKIENGECKIGGWAMRESGVEWIGEIPAEWDLVPARNLFSEVKDKNIAGKVTRQFSFRYGKIVDKDKSGRSDVTTDETITAYRIVTPDTIMINGLNLNYDFISQRVAIVEERGIITSAYLALCPNKKLIEPAFAVYLFKGYDSKQVFHGHGSGIRKTLNYSDFKEIKTVCPDLSTQRKIAAFLDKKCAAIDRVISAKESLIADLEAYKKSLIFECVTGKMEVA